MLAAASLFNLELSRYTEYDIVLKHRDRPSSILDSRTIFSRSEKVVDNTSIHTINHLFTVGAHKQILSVNQTI